MKKLAVILLIALFPCILFAQDEVKEVQEPWSFDTSVSMFSSYMFRGITLYDGVSFQPSATINYDSGDYGVFHVNFWGQLPAEGQKKASRFNEFDTTLTYDYSFEDFTLSAGHTWITYADDAYISYPETAEFFGSISFDNLFLAPSFTVFHDYRAYDSTYFQGLLSHTFQSEEKEWLNLTPFIDVGFGHNSEKYFYKTGFLQASVGASHDIVVGPVTITSTINYAMPHEDVDNKRVWGGITLTYSF